MCHSQRGHGEPDRRRLVAAYDGTPGPTRGMADAAKCFALSELTRLIADATFTFKGQPVFAYRAVRSADGRSLTVISVDLRAEQC